MSNGDKFILVGGTIPCDGGNPTDGCPDVVPSDFGWAIDQESNGQCFLIYHWVFHFLLKHVDSDNFNYVEINTTAGITTGTTS